jgi:hypothetical protein
MQCFQQRLSKELSVHVFHLVVTADVAAAAAIIKVC